MAKNKYKDFGFGIKTMEEKVLQAVRMAPVKDMVDFLLTEFLFEANTEVLRREVEDFLSEVYENMYLVRCGDAENTSETIAAGELHIRFVGIDEDFIVSIGKTSISEVIEPASLFIKSPLESRRKR